MAPLEQREVTPEATARPAWRRLLPVLVLIAAAWFGVSWLTSVEDRPLRLQGEAPLLDLQTFDGEEVSLAAQRGQGVVVNFWASWCEPCRAEAELLEEAWRAEQGRNEQGNSERSKSGQGPGITFIGVNRQDSPAAALAFLDEFGVTYPNGADQDGQWGRAFGIAGLPSTFFIDPQGHIQGVVWGPLTSAEDLARHLEQIRPTTGQ